MRKWVLYFLSVIVLTGFMPVAAAADSGARDEQRMLNQPKTSVKKPVKPAPIPAVKAAPTKGDAVVTTARKYLGVPYRFGGQTPSGFDCSGFVMYVYNQHGLKLPRTADKQFAVGSVIGERDRKPGDLVFFTTYEKGPSHCGIYVGDGKFIHASSSKGVTISALSDSYWKIRYLGARRLRG